MKLYNPFRWHAVQIPTGKYAVRRRAWFLMWWEYADIDGDNYVWARVNHVRKYCLTDDKERAVELAKLLRGSATVIWP